MHKDLFEKDFEKVVVVWWEYIHGENVASRTLQRIKWALPAFMGGKRGSVLQVQLSLRFKDSMEESMRRIGDFMDQLGPYIRAVLPSRQVGTGRVSLRKKNVLIDSCSVVPTSRDPVLR